MTALRLEGQLARDARRAVEPDGTAGLVLQVSQGPHSVCATARWRMGTGHGAQYACGKAAKRMTKGTRVLITAAGWELDRKAEQLVLVGVREVLQLDIPAPLGAQPEREAA
jgi:hypothetical protein